MIFDSGTPWLLALFVTFGILVLTVSVANWSIRIGKTKGVFSLLLCGTIFSIVGCSRNASDQISELNTKPPLRFSQPAVRLGAIAPGTAQSVIYPFVVDSAQPVKISRIVTSCGCTAADDSILNRPLEPGRTYDVRLTVKPDGEAGTFTKTVSVVTEPASDVPMVLAVIYDRFDPPRASVSELFVNGSKAGGVESTVRYVYRRKSSAPPVFVRRKKIQADHFVVRDVRTSSTRLNYSKTRVDQDLTEDVSEIHLVTKPIEQYGRHRGLLHVSFTDGGNDALRTLVDVAHPFQLDVSKFFAGVVQPNTVTTKRLAVRSSNNKRWKSAIVSVEGIVSEATLTEHNLSVVLSPGDRTGYQKGSVRLVFPDSDLANFTLPVSAMVK